MNYKIILQSIGVWVLLVPIAIINGTVRNYIYQPMTGELIAHWISSVVLSIMIIGITCVFLKKTKASFVKRDMILIGFLWLFLTIIFEFGFGHFVIGHPWEKLLADYNILKGRIWSLVLLTDLVSPYYVGVRLLK